LPRFAEPIPNVTVTIGRDALLACVVDNLRGYKVIQWTIYTTPFLDSRSVAKVSWFVSGPMLVRFTMGRERQYYKVQMWKEKKL
jgi:hypothetical protein